RPHAPRTADRPAAGAGGSDAHCCRRRSTRSGSAPPRRSRERLLDPDHLTAAGGREVGGLHDAHRPEVVPPVVPGLASLPDSGGELAHAEPVAAARVSAVVGAVREELLLGTAAEIGSGAGAARTSPTRCSTAAAGRTATSGTGRRRPVPGYRARR